MISVIVPIYNSEKYLERCIQSVLNQSLSELELILVDDCSTDSSYGICQSFANQDKRVVFCPLPTNHGVSSARNIGLQNSTSDYIFMLDSDDWLSQNALEKLLEIQRKFQSDCVICGLNQSSGVVWAPKENKEYNSFQHFQADFPYWLNTELLSCSVNKLYRRELITSYYPENMSFAEDLVFCLNYLRNCKRISFITDALYQHDVTNSSSLTHTFNMHRFTDVELMQNAILEFVDDDQTKNKLKTKYIKDIISVVRACFKASNYSIEEKTDRLKEWYSCSHLSSLAISDFFTLKDKIIFLLLKARSYGALNLIWNR